MSELRDDEKDNLKHLILDSSSALYCCTLESARKFQSDLIRTRLIEARDKIERLESEADKLDGALLEKINECESAYRQGQEEGYRNGWEAAERNNP